MRSLIPPQVRVGVTIVRHLGHCCQKLTMSSRRQLPSALAGQPSLRFGRRFSRKIIRGRTMRYVTDSGTMSAINDQRSPDRALGGGSCMQWFSRGPSLVFGAFWPVLSAVALLISVFGSIGAAFAARCRLNDVGVWRGVDARPIG
jgi:hypothetical protein